jgi:hypothetical protein
MNLRHTILVLACALVGCNPPHEPRAEPDIGPTKRAAVAEVDATCNDILSAIRANIAVISRDQLERLEGLARSNPKILAPPASSQKARDIVGVVGHWPVVENNGKWFVLENQGHPAGDGFFRVSVVDISASRLVGRIADTTGNAPVSAPVHEK